MAKQSRSQKETVGRVMHEYKHGELRIRGSGPKVKNPKQAIAIALHEAGATRQESPKKNRRNLRRTKAKERRGETAEAEKEGKRAQQATMAKASARKSSASKAPASRRASRSGERRKDELYAEAQRRNIPGRSRMSKSELDAALRR